MYGHGLRVVSRRTRALLYPQCRSLSRVQSKASILEKLADDMIKVASNPPQGWTGTMQSELTLLSDAQRKQLDRAPSMERIAFQGSESSTTIADDESGLSEWTVEPGTFVELRKNGVITSAVVLADCIVRGSRKLLSMTAAGEIWDHDSENALFFIPAFVPADLIQRCGIDPESPTRVNLLARVEVLRRVREVERNVALTMAALNAWDCDIYSTFKSSNPTKWSSLSVAELARMWITRPSVLHLYACHRYIMDRPLHFSAPIDYNVSQTFDVRPEAEVELIQTVTDWARNHGSPVTRFIAKAKEIVASNEKILAESFRSLEQPNWTPASHTWDENDLVILRFLANSIQPKRPSQPDPYQVAETKIVKGIFPGVQLLNEEWTHTLLMQLGLVAPWHDLISARSETRDYTEENEAARAAIAEKSLDFSGPAPLPSHPMGPLDLHRSDPLESIRRDFGEAFVYVIDDPNARELDDGISIEPIPTEPGRFWLHVHVADPCSILPPTHVLALEAARRIETMYLMDRTSPLLPDSLTVGPTGASLRDNGDLQRVMTFSSKVDTDGGLYESKVQAGLVRKIVKTTYDIVNTATGLPSSKKSYPFGAPPPSVLVQTSLSEDMVKELRLINSIGQGFIRQRLRDGSFTISKEGARLEHYNIPSHPNPSFTPGTFRGFPSAYLAVTKYSEMDVGAAALVAEAMKLACWSASRFCVEHNIPAIRRYAVPPAVTSDSKWQDILSNRGPTGYIEMEQILGNLVALSSADYSLEPRGHFGLCIPDGEGYVRVTSPLRRHSDLIVHWQIQAALLGKKPVFSSDWLANHAAALKVKEKVRRRLIGHYDTFLNMTFIQRFFQDPERREGKPNPFDNLQGWAMRSSTMAFTNGFFDCVLALRGLGVRGILKSNTDPNVVVGDLVNLKCVQVHTGLKPHIEIQIR